MLKKTIESFAAKIIEEHPQCTDWLDGYSTDFETQININPDGLEEAYSVDPTTKKLKQIGWTLPYEGSNYLVNHIRTPYGAMTNTPAWRDKPVHGPISTRWAYFGTSGWNWAQQRSYWVGFDFDSITNHTEGLSTDHLEEIKQRALSLDYVTARTSKSGEGIHLLVYLEPKPTTRNHNEHANLASFVLDRMSRDCGFNFRSAADCCGLILWHWQRNLEDGCCTRIDNI